MVFTFKENLSRLSDYFEHYQGWCRLHDVCAARSSSSTHWRCCLIQFLFGITPAYLKTAHNEYDGMTVGRLAAAPQFLEHWDGRWATGSRSTSRKSSSTDEFDRWKPLLQTGTVLYQKSSNSSFANEDDEDDETHQRVDTISDEEPGVERAILQSFRNCPSE